MAATALDPVAEKDFSLRLTPYKILGHFFTRSNTCPRIIRSKIVFLESGTFQLQGRMLSSFSAQSLKCYEYLSDPGGENSLSHCHVEKR